MSAPDLVGRGSDAAGPLLRRTFAHLAAWFALLVRPMSLKKSTVALPSAVPVPHTVFR